MLSFGAVLHASTAKMYLDMAWRTILSIIQISYTTHILVTKTSLSLRGTSMLLLSITLNWKELTPYSGIYTVLGTVLYVLAFSLGAGPVPAVLLPEIFASNIRAKAVALSLGVHWVLNFLIGLLFLSVMDKFGISFVYLCFSGVCFAAVIFVMNNVVETKGRSLEEIERALNTATSAV